MNKDKMKRVAKSMRTAEDNSKLGGKIKLIWNFQTLQMDKGKRVAYYIELVISECLQEYKCQENHSKYVEEMIFGTMGKRWLNKLKVSFLNVQEF